MRREFRKIDPRKARIILIESSPRILERYHESLSEAAIKSLFRLGAEVWTGSRLLDIGVDHALVLREGAQQKVPTANVLWAAGVKASPVGQMLAMALERPELLDRAGRVKVNEFCQPSGVSEIYVIGDMASQEGDAGPLPGVAPVAMQQGQFVARHIRDRIARHPAPRPFKYFDKGNMATIGRSQAVVESGSLRLTGKLAWLAWLFIHILYLTRFENRIMVLFQWSWNYLTRNRAARLITGRDLPPVSHSISNQDNGT
jgi:NADH dehydrogenase